MAFNMMALMNNRSKAQAAGQGRYELQNIPLEKLLPNPANEKIYEVGEIEELAQSILLTGKVLQNLVVTAADAEGNHTIIAGHRRHMACKKLAEGGYTEFAKAPCMVMSEQDNLLQELFLIQTNSTARVLSDAEKVRQAERATAILTELKERKQISGRVRDIAAKMLGTTKSQLARYNVISKGLTNETLKESFEKGEMGVSAAYEAARMDETKQEELAAKVDAGESVSIKDVVEQRENTTVQQVDVPTEEETDKTPHQNESAGNTDEEIEDLRKLWLRKKALKEVIMALKSQEEFAALQFETSLERPQRASVFRLAREIFHDFIDIAHQDMADLSDELGDWEKLFEQEAHA